MSTYDWPTDEALRPQIFTLGAVEKVSESASGYTGGEVTGEVPFSYRFRMTIGWPATPDFSVQARRIAFAMKVRRSHRIRIPFFNFVLNGFLPHGTMRGSPTLFGATAQGATSIAIATTTGNTLVAGDVIGVTTSAGVQAVTVVDDATSTGGVLTAAIEPPLRAAAANGSAIVYSKPTVVCRLTSQEWSATHRPREGQPIMLDFTETWT